MGEMAMDSLMRCLQEEEELQHYLDGDMGDGEAFDLGR